MIDLPYEQLQKIIEILSTLTPNTTVWAFGSRVKMTAKKYSDLDIVIQGTEKIPQKAYYQLKDAFEESDLPIKVDALDWHRISAEFQKNIEEQCIQIYPVE